MTSSKQLVNSTNAARARGSCATRIDVKSQRRQMLSLFMLRICEKSFFQLCVSPDEQLCDRRMTFSSRITTTLYARAHVVRTGLVTGIVKGAGKVTSRKAEKISTAMRIIEVKGRADTVRTSGKSTSSTVACSARTLWMIVTGGGCRKRLS